MKAINDKLQKHTLITLLLATALAGCDGQEAKAPGETLVPKVAEAEPVTAPAVQAKPLLPKPPAKPAAIMSTDRSGLVNVAKGKSAKLSAIYVHPEKGPALAALAVDGNVDGNYFNGSVAATSKDPNAWFDLDLGEPENIDHIVIWNRTDCCPISFLSNYWIFISNKPFTASDTAEMLRKDKSIISIKGGGANPSFSTAAILRSGRYVRIQFDGSNREKPFLQLAEVEVYRAR